MSKIEDAGQHPFLIAARNRRPPWVPVWFMRQAGRSLPEYRRLREKHSILEMCTTPELAAEATLQPVRRLGVDAAVLFSDIMVPLWRMGIGLDIEPGRGPLIEDPIRSRSGITRLRPLRPEEDVPEVLEAIRILKKELDVPLIGFAGAPFTLACYLVEGGPSRDQTRTKTLMRAEPRLWDELMERLTGATLAYLRAQVGAGADAVQLFDSWAGNLSPAAYERYVFPYSKKILEGLAGAGVPRIHFGVAAGELLALMAAAGADVVGVDWRVPLDAARQRVDGRALQGNLDPTALLAPYDRMKREALAVLRAGDGSGHIFNLGHGVLPQTDPNNLKRLVDLVHETDPVELQDTRELKDG